MNKIQKTRKSRATGSNGASRAPLALPDSPSPLRELYRDPEFRLAWDNDLPLHIARAVRRLRDARNMTQAELAAAAGTTQSRIARIEAAGQNLTIDTLMRIVRALGGRVRLTIMPEELGRERGR